MGISSDEMDCVVVKAVDCGAVEVMPKGARRLPEVEAGVTRAEVGSAVKMLGSGVKMLGSGVKMLGSGVKMLGSGVKELDSGIKELESEVGEAKRLEGMDIISKQSPSAIDSSQPLPLPAMYSHNHL